MLASHFGFPTFGSFAVPMPLLWAGGQKRGCSCCRSRCYGRGYGMVVGQAGAQRGGG